MKKKRQIAFKLLPNDNIRGYKISDKSGASEYQITNPNNISPTVTATWPPKIWYKYGRIDKN